jgi:hypothetical protein
LQASHAFLSSTDLLSDSCLFYLSFTNNNSMQWFLQQFSYTWTTADKKKIEKGARDAVVL